MNPCPECNSNNVYRYKEEVDALGGYGPDLLPKLSKNLFSPAKFLPVVCIDCGYVRFFAAKEARYKMENSEDWLQG